MTQKHGSFITPFKMYGCQAQDQYMCCASVSQVQRLPRQPQNVMFSTVSFKAQGKVPVISHQLASSAVIRYSQKALRQLAKVQADVC